MPADVLKGLSHDQKLMYQLSMIVATGEVDMKVVTAIIGVAMHARWNTLTSRILRWYISLTRPSAALKKFVSFIQNVYIPGWFLIKCHPHCQDGARNFFGLIQFVQEQPLVIQNIALPVLQWNGYWGHAENVIIAMLSDHRQVIRQRAVSYIQSARRNYDPDQNPRLFSVQELNMKANFYFDIVDLAEDPKTEPPLTMGLTDDEISAAITEPLTLPKYHCHTQQVEYMVALVAESCTQRVGPVNRHRWILNTLKSRQDRPKAELFNLQNHHAYRSSGVGGQGNKNKNK